MKKENLMKMTEGRKNNRLLVSFSGGETSAFLSIYLKKKYKELGFNEIIFVFANTGQELNETLDFINKVDITFKLRLNWIESKVFYDKRKGSSYNKVNYLTATRLYDFKSTDRTPFESIIKKYGIPNISYPHCSRELKLNPIKAFGKDYFNGSEYMTAIGIRADELDRVSINHKKNNIIYPLLDLNVNLSKIDLFWSKMPFRLEIPRYKGNCVTCWKKSINKLEIIANENPSYFDFFLSMEEKYKKTGQVRNFFRENKTCSDILNNNNKKNILQKTTQIDLDTILFDLEMESCDIYSNCEDNYNESE